MIVDMIKSTSFTTHLIINLFIRIGLIFYGDFMDATSEVPYTDIDYRVITDGASHVLNGTSPYQRHTYRYSPLLAYLVIPNLICHKSFGKFLFAIFDLFVGILIKQIIANEFKSIFYINAQFVIDKFKDKDKEMLQRKILETTKGELSFKYRKIAELSALLWLYNPLTMIIATRGNGDAISSLLVLATIYYLLKPWNKASQFFLAGAYHGIAIHFRLYPIMFSLAYYLALSDNRFHSVFEFIKIIIKPNWKQIQLILGTMITLFGLTAIFYHLYGFEFIYETYLYHMGRKDIRHNFSLFFYMQYLRSDIPGSSLDKIFTIAPIILIIISLSITFGKNRKTLPFCIFTQTFVMVTYNSVVTSQYFVWFLALLPLCAKNLKRIGYKSTLAYCILWFLAQGGWLLPAYLLEFKGWNTFELIWIQGLMFFSSNIFILQRLISNFDVLIDFGVKTK